MRTSLFFAFFLLVFNFINAQSTAGIDSAAYEKSLAVFEKGKALHQNNYQFAVSFASFSGYWSKTTFVVQNGKVVERHYQSGHEYQKGKHTKNWKEKGLTLGSHKEEGQSILTMDDIYQTAKSWIAKTAEKQEVEKENTDAIESLKISNTYYFSTDKADIIETAGLRPDGCMDDCFRGYRIRDFKWL